MKKCDFCGDERQEDRISEKKKPIILDGEPAGEQIRNFCNDRSDCKQKATQWWLE